MSRAYDLTGRQFGRLAALYRVPNPHGTNALWACRCSCPANTIVYVTSSHLLDGHTRFCGCLLRESYHIPNSGQFRKKYKTDLEYDASRLLIGMKRRCYDPKNKDYQNYGGRGGLVSAISGCWIQKTLLIGPYRTDGIMGYQSIAAKMTDRTAQRIAES